MGQAKWLGSILLICNALPSVLSQGELEEAMQWMMIEQVSSHVKGEEKQLKQREIEFVLYKKGPNRGAPTKVDAPGVIHNGALSAGNSIRICVFGWQNDLKSEFVTSFVNLYTNKRKNFQVVVVNWKGAQMDYIGARRLIPYVAAVMLKYLMRLQIEVKVDLGKLIIIGHGFGAQIAGAVGHLLRGNIGTIIALDPMAPLFWENTRDSVNASSAKRVIGVHTSSGYFGVYWNVGHADFWVNRGSAPQPGCFQTDWRRTIVCSHEKSFRYFIEAVLNPQAFHSVECGKKLACTPASERKPLATGFFFERTKINGQFCFHTNPTPPYSLAVQKSSEEGPTEPAEPAKMYRQMRPGTRIYSRRHSFGRHRRSSFSKRHRTKHAQRKVFHITHNHTKHH